VNSTTEAPDDGILEDQLAVTDGTQTWEPDVLEAVTSATEQDPTLATAPGGHQQAVLTREQMNDEGRVTP
jgi:hypothetical protein